MANICIIKQSAVGLTTVLVLVTIRGDQSYSFKAHLPLMDVTLPG